MDTDKGSLTEEEMVGITQQIENELTKKMKDEIKKTENSVLRALGSPSENSLRDDHNSPIAEMKSDGENVNLVQTMSRGPESVQKKFGPNETFIGAQPHPDDSLRLSSIFNNHKAKITYI